MPSPPPPPQIKTSSEDYQSVVDLDTKFDSSKPQKMSIKQYLASFPQVMRHLHLPQNQFVIWKLLMLLTVSDPAPSFSSTLLILSSHVWYYGCSLGASILSPSFWIYFTESQQPWNSARLRTGWPEGAHLVNYRASLMWPNQCILQLT